MSDNHDKGAYRRTKVDFGRGLMTHLGHRASTASVRLGVARTVKRRPFAMWGHMVAAPSPVSAAVPLSTSRVTGQRC